MNPEEYIYDRSEGARREQKDKERKDKWEKRKREFWRTFLLTEDGKPKSGLVLYTFCLSFVFVAVYIFAFWAVIEETTPWFAGWAPLPVNAVQSLGVSALGVLLSYALHKLLPDKRLAFGTHLWLALYTVACVITLAVMLGSWDTIYPMLVFALWFAVIPVGIGLWVTYLLYRRDHHVKTVPEKEPEWKKYTNRRN